jgi:hypothetical protein
LDYNLSVVGSVNGFVRGSREQGDRGALGRGPIAVIGAAVVVLAACLTAAMFIGPSSASATKPTAAALPLPLPNVVGQSDAAAAARLEAMGVGVVFVPDPASTAKADTVTGEQPRPGTPVTPGSTVTLTYVAPPNAKPNPTPRATNTPSAPPTVTTTVTAPPVAGALVKGAGGPQTTTVVPPLVSGVYVSGQPYQPHYYVSVTVTDQHTLSGVLDYEYTTGQTTVVFTFTGTINGNVLTLFPGPVQAQPAGTAALAANVPTAISVNGDSGGMVLGQCAQYLTAIRSPDDCSFLPSGGNE